MVCDYIKKIFKEDKAGEVSLEVCTNLFTCLRFELPGKFRFTIYWHCDVILLLFYFSDCPSDWESSEKQKIWSKS